MTYITQSRSHHTHDHVSIVLFFDFMDNIQLSKSYILLCFDALLKEHSSFSTDGTLFYCIYLNREGYSRGRLLYVARAFFSRYPLYGILFKSKCSWLGNPVKQVPNFNWLVARRGSSGLTDSERSSSNI